MNLREELLREHSKKQTIRIVDYVGDDKERFAELMNLFLTDVYRIGQRAAWPVSYCGSAHPELITPYIKKMLKNLNNPVHDSVKRNTVRVLQNFHIPKALQGLAVKQCMRLVEGNEPIAIKVFSITLLGNIAKEHPELKHELKILIETQIPYASAGFLSRATKILKSLEENKRKDAKAQRNS